MKIAVSVGCPCGIGPEVAVRAVADLEGEVPVVLHGDRGAISDAAALLGVALHTLPHVSIRAVSDLPPAERRWGHPGPAAGRAQLDAVDAALDCVRSGAAAALVTGPVSKGAIASTGVHFVGHTEHLQARTGAPRVVMFFAGPRLRTSLVTTHVPIARVAALLDVASVAATTVLTARALRRDYGLAHPRIAVSGLNPHAGEGGLFGLEDRDVIAPAVARAAAELGAEAQVSGPVPAEAAFRQARDGRWDAVVAMFHDQATIASKLLDFGDAVNVTLGLPIVRTSVDHGTGYDIAGRGVADAAGMRAALAMAIDIARRRGSGAVSER